AGAVASWVSDDWLTQAASALSWVVAGPRAVSAAGATPASPSVGERYWGAMNWPVAPEALAPGAARDWGRGTTETWAGDGGGGGGGGWGGGGGGGARRLSPGRGTRADPATASTPASKSAAAMMRIMRGSSEGGSLGLGLVDATVLHLQVGQRLLVHLALLA